MYLRPFYVRIHVYERDASGANSALRSPSFEVIRVCIYVLFMCVYMCMREIPQEPTQPCDRDLLLLRYYVYACIHVYVCMRVCMHV
jgi:hypothetical protein